MHNFFLFGETLRAAIRTLRLWFRYKPIFNAKGMINMSAVIGLGDRNLLLNEFHANGASKFFLLYFLLA
jgi:hypothetical protein